MLFQQTLAPTGWTKQTTHNNKGLRLTTGTVTTGGTDSFSTVFGAGKSTAGHTLTISEMPSHTHTAGSSQSVQAAGGVFCRKTDAGGVATAATGGGGSHSHNLSNLDLQFVDFIIAIRD